MTLPRGPRLAYLAAALGGHRVLVVGDACLDEYILGEPVRLSREAPVPVLEFASTWTVPGAAANPARNIIALGSHATMATVVGADDTAEALMAHLDDAGIDRGPLIARHEARTTRKTRILSASGGRVPQQIVRIDRTISASALSSATPAIARYIREHGPTYDAILVSDYRGGVVSDAVIDAVRTVAAGGTLATVDSQGDLRRFTGFAVVKANREEAAASLGVRLLSDEEVAEHGRALLARLEARSVVITRGAAGLSVIDASGEVAHVPATNHSEVFDVTGAGDTVIAVMTLALAAEGTTIEAAVLANAAAGLVVRRLGNAVVTVPELVAAVG